MEIGFKQDSLRPLSAPLLAWNTVIAVVLATGIWTTGGPLRAPMPQFRMAVVDAEAVVAYLKSLTPHQ